MLGERRCGRSGAPLVPERGRAHHVREQEGDRSGRQIATHGLHMVRRGSSRAQGLAPPHAGRCSWWRSAELTSLDLDGRSSSSARATSTSRRRHRLHLTPSRCRSSRAGQTPARPRRPFERRPVGPEVAGSSPVAPALYTSLLQGFFGGTPRSWLNAGGRGPSKVGPCPPRARLPSSGDPTRPSVSSSLLERAPRGDPPQLSSQPSRHSGRLGSSPMICTAFVSYHRRIRATRLGRRRAMLGTTSVSVLRDEQTAVVPVEGWAFDAARSAEEATLALTADRGAIRVLRTVLASEIHRYPDRTASPSRKGVRP
jgi:hypothetical protein